MQLESYAYYVFDHELSNDKELHYSRVTDKKTIAEAGVNDLVVIKYLDETDRQPHYTRRSSADIHPLLAGIYDLFNEHYGHTITADEEEFDLLFVARVYNRNNYHGHYSYAAGSLHDQKLGQTLNNFNEFFFRISSRLMIGYEHLKNKEALKQIAGYVKKYGQLDLTELYQGPSAIDFGDTFRYLKYNLQESYAFFNAHDIFVRPTKMTLEHNPKRAARQAKIYQARHERKSSTRYALDIGYDEMRIVYNEARAIAEYALSGEDIKDYGLLQSRVGISRRIPAIIDLIDALYIKKPYRNLESFHLLKKKVKQMIDTKEKRLEKYDKRFIKLMRHEIICGPKKPRLFRRTWEIKETRIGLNGMKGFLFDRIRKNLKYIRNAKYEFYNR